MKTQTTRRKLTPEFKAKVVIEALREQSTLADIAKELRNGIKDYIEYYNNKRPHQGIDHQIPMTKYAKSQHNEENVAKYLPVPQRMITFAAPKEWTMLKPYTVAP